VSFLFHQAGKHFYAGVPQALVSASGNGGIGVVNGGYYTLNSSLDNRFRARTSAAGVIARFKRDVHGRAFSFFSRGFYGHDLGVIAQLVLVKTFTNNLPFTHQHASDEWIRAGQASALARQAKCTLHVSDGVLIHG
jgi:hypothetical protein